MHPFEQHITSCRRFNCTPSVLRTSAETYVCIDTTAQSSAAAITPRRELNRAHECASGAQWRTWSEDAAGRDDRADSCPAPAAACTRTRQVCSPMPYHGGGWIPGSKCTCQVRPGFMAARIGDLQVWSPLPCHSYAQALAASPLDVSSAWRGRETA